MNDITTYPSLFDGSIRQQLEEEQPSRNIIEVEYDSETNTTTVSLSDGDRGDDDTCTTITTISKNSSSVSLQQSINTDSIDRYYDAAAINNNNVNEQPSPILIHPPLRYDAWTEVSANKYRVRGKTYLSDRIKQRSEESAFQLF